MARLQDYFLRPIGLSILAHIFNVGDGSKAAPVRKELEFECIRICEHPLRVGGW